LKRFNKNFWKNKKVLVTGHTGFKGSWLCLLLKILGAKIAGYSLKPKKISLFNIAFVKKILHKNFYGDICDLKKISKVIKLTKPDFIFHLAAQSIVSEGFKNPIETMRVNALGTCSLIEASELVKSIRKIIIITTDKVYNYKKNLIFNENDLLKGSDPYSISKVSAENMIEFYNKKNQNKILVARSGNVIGGGDFSENRLIPDIFNAIKSKKKLPIRNPNHIRPWLHVIEPLIGYLKLASYNKINTSNVFNFGPNLKNVKNVKYIINYINKKQKFSFYIKKRNSFYEKAYLKLNINKSKKILNWKQMWSLNQTLDKIIEWNYFINKDISAKKICDKQISDYLKSID